MDRETTAARRRSDEGQLAEAGLKRCSACLETKPLDEFYSADRYADGLFCQCKACQTKGIRAAEKRRQEERAAEGKCKECEWPALVGRLCLVHHRKDRDRRR